MQPGDNKKYNWHKVADNIQEIEFATNGLAQVEIGGKKICITGINDELGACAAKCPHAGGILADGYIDATGNIVCPLHRYKFSLKNGRNVTGEGYCLKIFPVEIRDGAVYIGFEQNNFFNWLK